MLTRNQPHKAAFLTATHYVKKRVKRQSSKPLFGWLQKKLALGGSMRASSSSNQPQPRPRAVTLQQLESPLPRNSEAGPAPPPGVVDDQVSSHMGRSTYPRSSRSSTWSPSQPETADDDASIRPLPPTSPPSPAPSRSSSSYLSDPRTFRSVAVSTKPTTLISVDLGTNGNGMAHIAQAPPTPASVTVSSASAGSGTVGGSGLPRFSTSSVSVTNSGSITFSVLQPGTTTGMAPSPSSSSPVAGIGPSSLLSNGTAGGAGGAGSTLSPTIQTQGPGAGPTVQAPLHTSHHPRYNPRPGSPPQDNASMLTLASSAFAFPGGRMGGWVGSDSQSQFGVMDGEDGQGELEGTPAEEDASVIALRPRSSRRGSWESEGSGWSSKPPFATSRSLHGNSIKVRDEDGSAEGDSEGCTGGKGPVGELSVEETKRTPTKREEDGGKGFAEKGSDERG